MARWRNSPESELGDIAKSIGGYWNTSVSRRNAFKIAGATLMATASASRIGWGEDLLKDADSSSPSEANLSYGGGVSIFGGGASIFPRPREIENVGAPFSLDTRTSIVLPLEPSEHDLVLSRFLTEELSDRFDLQLHSKRVRQLPGGSRSILMGSINNPLIRAFCNEYHLDLSAQKPGPEGYILRVSPETVLIAGSDERGAFYGLQSLRQLVQKDRQELLVPGVNIRDWPAKPFRGIFLFLPGRANLNYFKNFVRDVAALYKCNALIVEVDGCMRFDRHPEVNAGWVEFARDVTWRRRNTTPGTLHGRSGNSPNQDCGDSGFIEKSEMADIVRWTRQHYLEFIPEIASLTHCFYLLSRHKDLSEVPGEKWPDTYCASNPASHKLLFDVMDEYIEVIRPKMVHAGHDEWFAPFGLCPRCKGKDPGVVLGRDLRTIHEHLAGRNIKMAIWPDYLLENVRGKGLQRHVAPDGWVYHTPGAMTPQQVHEFVPKDILLFPWLRGERFKGAANEALIQEWGFKMAYGNMEPYHSPNYVESSKRASIIGGEPSAWAATTEFNMNKDMLYSILGCSGMLWTGETMAGRDLSQITQSRVPSVRPHLRELTPPSAVGDPPVMPIDISASFNNPLQVTSFGVDLRGMASGKIESGNMVFALSSPSAQGANAIVVVGTEGKEGNPLPREADIKIGEDVTSLIFLHACARPASNRKAYRLTWDERDSADLLGWYEVIYQDGLKKIIPVRYSINILEWNWGGVEHKYGRDCYDADAIPCGRGGKNSPMFFAYEWTNPRLGKVIKEVRLGGSNRFHSAARGYKNTFGEILPNNSIMLNAISFVGRRG